MYNNAAQEIKNYLEIAYDIPFDIKKENHFQDLWFEIKPHNEGKELFEIDLKIKNNLRLVAEVKPEKYAAFSIKDMGETSKEKKMLFSGYAKKLLEKKAKIIFLINDTTCNILDIDTWPETWENYKLRVSRSPICSENEEFDEVDVVSSWATIITGMFLSLLDVIKTEEKEHLEGGLKRLEVNRYERNPINRELCLLANGYKCKICGFDFEEKYGEIGKRFIHVHHLIPVSDSKEAYIIDPVNDMVPVCPNCHAMLHKFNPPLFPEELKKRIKK